MLKFRNIFYLYILHYYLTIKEFTMQNETLLRQPTLSGIFYTLGAITIAILCLIYFDGIIKPFIVALIFWYLIKELKNLAGRIKFRGKSLPGWWRGFFSILIIGLIVFGVFELIIINVQQMNEVAPDYREKLDNLVSKLSGFVNDPQFLSYVREAVSKINFARLITEFVNSLSSMVADFAVVVVYVIFMLMEEAAGSKKIKKLFPVKGKAYNDFNKMIGKIDTAIRAYMVNMVLISFITAVISYVAIITKNQFISYIKSNIYTPDDKLYLQGDWILSFRNRDFLINT